MTTTNQTTIYELRLAAKQFYEIREEIKKATSDLNPVEIVTPINVKTEKKKWIRHAKQNFFNNPHFEYDLVLLEKAIAKRPLLNQLLEKLESMKPDQSSIAEHFVWEQLHFALCDGIGTTYLAEAIKKGDNDDTADAVAKKYGLPSEDHIDFAFQIARNNIVKNRLDYSVFRSAVIPKGDGLSEAKQKLGADFIKEMFDWTMQRYNIKPWPVIIDDKCTSIDVRDKSQFGEPVVVVPTTRQVTGIKLAELIGHEIECHWRSSANAESIGALKCDDELIYEGLAALKDKSFNRDYCGTFNLNSIYYIIAMDTAMNCESFAETAHAVYTILPSSIEDREAKAWMYTYRVFRGISDTDNPNGYAFTKDRAYFEGWLYAKELEAANKASYLSFSTLNQRSFERLMEIINIDDLEKNVSLDCNLQEQTIDIISQKVLSVGAQAEGLIEMAVV
ncbi:DUF1704 domain-containing protein [Candidatus Saccharibacteria bacterium]|nr:DUF1704 domain-containing protein [Candidatus Saccharibacteria bacterium]